MPGEASIEMRLIRHRQSILGIRDSLYVRRCRIAPGFGVADLVILPQRGKHKLVIVEAKQASSADARIKVVGQLLMYYAGALQMGLRGVRLLRQYAVERYAAAQSTRRSSLKAIAGGSMAPEDAWATMSMGRKLRPDNIRLIAALDAKPEPTLKQALSALANHHGLSVGVVSTLGRNDVRLWTP